MLRSSHCWQVKSKRPPAVLAGIRDPNRPFRIEANALAELRRGKRIGAATQVISATMSRTAFARL